MLEKETLSKNVYVAPCLERDIKAGDIIAMKIHGHNHVAWQSDM